MPDSSRPACSMRRPLDGHRLCGRFARDPRCRFGTQHPSRTCRLVHRPTFFQRAARNDRGRGCCRCHRRRVIGGCPQLDLVFGPKLALGANTLLLAYLMYRSRLVPRFIAVIGLIGGPLVFASGTAVLFGLYEDLSTVGVMAAAPVFAWELSLAVWMLVKGFRLSPVFTRPPVGHRPAFHSLNLKAAC